MMFRGCCCTVCTGQMTLGVSMMSGNGAPDIAVGKSATASKLRSYTGYHLDWSGVQPVHHVGIVSRDRDDTLDRLNNARGGGPSYAFEGLFPDAVHENGTRGLWLRGAFLWMHNIALEVVEPMDELSPHFRFLQERGEGLHHLAYWVDSVRQEIDTMSQSGSRPKLLVDGTGPGNDVPWCYVEGDLIGGAIVELIERTPVSEQFYAEVFKAIGGKIPS
jgi:methylmalonyl-CoA/ethylmalonyl-CoA epimerase